MTNPNLASCIISSHDVKLSGIQIFLDVDSQSWAVTGLDWTVDIRSGYKLRAAVDVSFIHQCPNANSTGLLFTPQPALDDLVKCPQTLQILHRSLVPGSSSNSVYYGKQNKPGTWGAK